MENGLRKGSIGKDEPFKEGEASFYIVCIYSVQCICRDTEITQEGTL